MRAAGLTSFGPPEVLRVLELDEPQAGAGEIRVRVRAAGVLPYDCGVRRGGFPPGPALPLPLVPGNEFAGVVDQVGDGVTGVPAGAEVLGFSTRGSYAEYIVVPADQAVRKPAGMPWEVAGAFSGTAQGAHLAVEQMGVGPGDVVLIDAAAGGLGTMAVQLAALRGAKTVVGTASPANHEYLRSLGAVPVQYGDGLVERIRAVAPGGVDAALGAGLDGLRAAVAVAVDRDRVVPMVFSDEHAALGLRDWTGVRSAARLAEMVALHEGGALAVHLRAVLPLDRAADAHSDVEGGHGRGKVVLAID
jgi:NADPH:quinone reductase-like Zn-dependent oxidoreductase